MEIGLSKLALGYSYFRRVSPIILPFVRPARIRLSLCGCNRRGVHAWVMQISWKTCRLHPEGILSRIRTVRNREESFGAPFGIVGSGVPQISRDDGLPGRSKITQILNMDIFRPSESLGSHRGVRRVVKPLHQKLTKMALNEDDEDSVRSSSNPEECNSRMRTNSFRIPARPDRFFFSNREHPSTGCFSKQGLHASEAGSLHGFSFLDFPAQKLTSNREKQKLFRSGIIQPPRPLPLRMRTLFLSHVTSRPRSSGRKLYANSPPQISAYLYCSTWRKARKSCRS